MRPLSTGSKKQNQDAITGCLLMHTCDCLLMHTCHCSDPIHPNPENMSVLDSAAGDDDWLQCKLPSVIERIQQLLMQQRINLKAVIDISAVSVDSD